MGPRVAVLLLVAGCKGILGLEEGTVGKPDAPVDTALVDMPTDDPPNLDPDNDGVDDPADNCPTVMNPGQQNFDGDARGDACDPCPHLSAIDADMDDDHDGLGALCDPRPLIAGDERVLFVTFDSASDIAGWTPSTAGWAVANGTLNQTISDNTTRISLPGTIGLGYYAASADITAVGGAPYIGICSHLSSSAYLCCDVTSGSTQIPQAISDSSATPGTTWIPSGYIPGTHIEFEQRTEISGFRCTWKEAGDTRSELLGQMRNPANLALHVRSTAAKFNYVFFARAP